MNKSAVEIIEAEIRSLFPLGNGLTNQDTSELIADAVKGIGDEYVEIGYELSAMRFEDAMAFLPIVLLGELQLSIAGKLDQCFICVVNLIESWGALCATHLSSQQRSVLCKWLHFLYDGNEMMNTSTIKSGINNALCILGGENGW